MSVPSTEVSWWLDHIATPMLFTCFGAILGLALGRLNDWLDDRKAKDIFLRAIRVELSVIRGHLEGTLKDAKDVREKLETKEQVALHLATVFQIGVYSSQIGKLKDVFDPLVIEIIQFYDRLSNLERIKSRLTEVSFELATKPQNTAENEGATGAHYRTTLDELIKRINQLEPAADDLIRKLPPK